MNKIKNPDFVTNQYKSKINEDGKKSNKIILKQKL